MLDWQPTPANPTLFIAKTVGGKYRVWRENNNWFWRYSHGVYHAAENELAAKTAAQAHFDQR